MNRIEDILHFWFGNYDENTVIDKNYPNSKLWWSKDPKVDQKIKTTFESDIIRAKKEEYQSWKNLPKGCLALIILWDQFSRNIYRNTPQSFENDPLALELCLKSIENEIDKKLIFLERSFFYMPLMHSEELEIQKKSLQMFNELTHEAEKENHPNAKTLKWQVSFAESHYDIIKQFGRYPHRNSILGRKSTKEELAFLKKPDSSF